MNKKDAEEFTESLGQIVSGGWRQAALAERLGVPEALGLTTKEWVQERLGGYIKMSVTQRREAVAELTEEGMSNRTTADILGVDETTVRRDKEPDAANAAPAEKKAAEKKAVKKTPAANAAPEPEPVLEQACPTCHGTGWVPVAKEAAA